MDPLEDQLARWTHAELIAPEQAEAIRTYERDRAPEARPRRPRTGAAEAVGYVGAALALGATGLILGDLWQELVLAGRLALVAVLTLAVFGAGLALRGSRSDAMQRLTSVLFTATVAGTGWFAAVITDDVLDLAFSTGALVIGLAMLAVALTLYAWMTRGLLQLAVLVAVLISAVAALDLPEIIPGPGWHGLVVGGIGLAWFLLALGAWLAPGIVGEVAGALVAFIGVQVGSFGSARLLGLAIGVALAGGLVLLAVRSDALHQLVIGALALFVLSPQLVFEIFGDAIGAPATLLLVGLLLVLLAVGLGRARREVGDRDDRDDPALEVSR